MLMQHTRFEEGTGFYDSSQCDDWHVHPRRLHIYKVSKVQVYFFFLFVKDVVCPDLERFFLKLNMHTILVLCFN